MSKTDRTAAEEAEWQKRKEEKRLKKEQRLKEKAEKKEKIETEAEKLRKRKREPLPEELEIDVALPEPVSKKELRKAKKAKTKPAGDETATTADSDEKTGDKKESKDGEAKNKDGTTKRSEFGVWIGNLPWSATKDTLKDFITSNTEIPATAITRVNMPAPTRAPNPNWTTKPLNKGFAYVDFSDQLSMYAAIALTETKMDGRPLLIKNASNFEGRPEKAKAEEFFGDSKEAGKEGKEKAVGKSGNPPNKRVFVGNLGFDTTKEDLQAHYGQCGEILDIHMATFEDSGKCKGYAWVTFEDVEAATSAVRGFIFKQPKVDSESEDEEQDEEMKDADAAGSSSDSDDEEKPKKTKKAPKKEKKKPKPQKWYVNRLQGRELRCEFAEDSTTRYNKRYGKEKKAVEGMDGVHPDRLNRLGEEPRRPKRNFGGDRREQQREEREKRFADKQGEMGERKPRKKVDPRTIKSGAAHTAAPRAPQGIVPAEGKKITFD